MKKIILLASTLVMLCPGSKLLAQQGINGALNIAAGTSIVNEYTAITAFIGVGSTSITVANSSLNANGRFSGPLAPGDLIMIYQAQGTIIKDITQAPNPDTTWGKVVNAGDYFATGYYEFHQVVSVPNATTINIDCGTTNYYVPNAGTARKPEVIRVPRYTSVTITGGVLTCDDWNGTIGGVLAIEVQNNMTVTAPGSVDATGKGFRGGSLVGDNVTVFGSNTNATTNAADGAEKGESVAGYQAEYDAFGGRYGRAPSANGGGGGCGHNAGGGGGANAPNSTSATAFWSGNGIPDQTGPSWTTAWNIEPPINTMSLRTAANSAGGGRGGYSFSANNQNAITVPPGNGTWGGDGRNYQATGLGGRPLDYSTGRLFLGGGGGAGDQNNSGGGNGGDGGGLIYLMVFGNLSGNGVISSNGVNGFNAVGGSGFITGIDGAGGGGAGGTVVANAVGGVANTLTINTNGGNGGNQVINLPFSSNEGEGPGGGGGGGYIAVSSGTPTRTSTGGNNGTTNSGGLTEFTPNGATKGCPGTNNATITNWQLSTTNVTLCTGQSTTLTATVVGTPPPGYTIYWYAAAVGGASIGTGASYTTPVLVATTTYYVTTCPGWWRVPVTVTVVGTPTVTASASTNPICSGNSTTLTASGANTYTWNPGALSGASVTVSPASTTTYTVTGTAIGGCFNTATITVTVNPTPTVTASASSSTICSGNSTTLTGSGATTYTWNPGALSGTSVVVSPASTTTYTVTGTSSGCSSTAQVTITVNPSPTVTASASPTTICSGNSTTLTGGGASTYTWNPGALSGSSVSVTPAATTTYTATGTAANGCTSTAQVTVTVNPTPTVTATSSPPTICSGQSSSLTASGATTYSWMPGSLSGSTVTVTPASSTTYTVTGTTGSCSSTTLVNVIVIPTPTVTATASAPTICSGNSTTLTGSGASTYNWMPGSLSGTSVSVSPATTTTYTVTGTAANGCTSTAQVTVTVNPTPTVTATAASPTICSGNSTTLTGSGATTYTWMPGSLSGTTVTVTPAATTTYTVTGDLGGCTSTAQVTVTVVTTPTVTASASSSTICNGSSTTLTASGATTYSWMPGSLSGTSVTVSPSTTTTYTVTGDSGGCTSTAQVTITVNPLPTPTANSNPTTICFGQSVSLTSSGGITYNWNGGNLVNASGSSQTDSPAASATYTVVVTDVNGCSAAAMVSVTVNALPIANAGIDQAVCNGASVNLLATGGTTYIWNGGALVNANGASQTDTPVSTTSYVVTVTDANGCSANDTMQVIVNPLPTVTAGPDVSKCINSVVQLNASGASTYSWSPATGLDFTNIPNPNASGTVSITYVVTGTDVNGCVNSDTITVNIGNNLSVNAGADVAICSGDTANLGTSGGVVYAWSPSATLGTPSAANTTAFPATTTTYIVNVTDANACSGSDTVTVFVSGPVTLAASGTTTICIGQSANITATPSNGTAPYTYTWSNGLTGGSPQTVSPIVSTTYSVSVTDSIGCSSPVQTITITVNPPLSLASINPAAICNGTTTSITASASGGDGNYIYNWMPGAMSGSSVTVGPVTTTTYTVVVSDGCGTPADTAMVTVTVNPVATLILNSTPANCSANDGTASVSPAGGTAGYTYLWNTNATTDTITSLAPGSYNVTVTDANGCVSAGTVTVGSSGTATANAGTSVTINAGDSTMLTGTGSGTTFSWSPGTDLSCANCSSPYASPTTTTTYTLTVTDANGCTATDTVTVFVDVNCGNVYLPNAFSPNGDLHNDVYYVRGNCFKYFQLEIYNRWGEKVFESTDPAKGWDGTWRGDQCEAAVFTYYFRATMLDDSQVEFQGNISLVK